MREALRYEWLRIRSVRSTYWLSGGALLVALLVALGVSWATVVTLDGSGAPPGFPADLVGAWLGTQFAAAGAPYFVAFLLAMLGILAWGHEYRHGMIRATLTALPSRGAVWAAKYVVVLAWVAVTVASCYVLSSVAGWLVLTGAEVEVFTGAWWPTLARAVLYAVLLVALAMAFTGLVRNQTAALVLLFLWPLAVENVISLIFFLVPALRDHQELTRFLPFSAGARILSDGGFAPSETAFGTPLSWVGGLVVFGGLAVVVLAASLVLFRRRDA